ncbi:MAG: DUF2490 domain-containing protein [Chitinophagales bacterium]
MLKFYIRNICLSLFSLLILIGLTQPMLAQSVERHTDQQFNNWFVPSLNLRVHKYVGFYLEGQLRFNQFTHSQQHQLRGNMDVFVNDKVTISPIGYVYTWNYKYGKQPVAVTENEHRIYEQINIKLNTCRLFFEQRLRLEQRWQEHKVKQSDGSYQLQNYIYKNRLRYRIMVNVPINHKVMDAHTVFFSAWDEVFISFGKNVTYRLPDQNRAYAGFGYKFSKYGTVQLGYLHQLIIKKEGMLAESNHTLFVGFNYVVDFTKMRKHKQ